MRKTDLLNRSPVLSLPLAAAAGMLAVVTMSVSARTPQAGAEADSAFGDCVREVRGNPFASPEVQLRLSSGLARAMEESRERQQHRQREYQDKEAGHLRSEHHYMGWAVSDEAYLSRIPVAARTLPADMSQLPTLRFTNTDIGGERALSYSRGREYDQWLLRDVQRNIASCISVNRPTRRVYFMEFIRRGDSWEFATAFDNCYTCHPSGPRVIRPFDEPLVDHRLLARFNSILLSYGACDFGDSVNDTTHGAAHPDVRCAGCHDGKRRGRLYAIHAGAIEFKTKKELTMPP